MNGNKPHREELSVPTGPSMLVSMRSGVVKALREHRLQGRSVIAWDRETGQVVEVPSTEIVIPEDQGEGPLT